jgi:cyclopropane-fatty-acyl-phospholipid synthase
VSTARTVDGHGPSTFSERVVDAMLSRALPAGSLEVTWPRGGATTSYEGREPGPHAEVTLGDHDVAKRVIREGSLGLAEGYMAGEWDTPDLRAVLDLGAAGMAAGGMEGAEPRAGIGDRILHALRSNSRRGSDATSPPTTTSATTSTGCGSTTR